MNNLPIALEYVVHTRNLRIQFFIFAVVEARPTVVGAEPLVGSAYD